MVWRGAHLTLPRTAVRTQGGNLTELGKQFFLTNINSGTIGIEETHFTLDSIHIELIPIADSSKAIGPFAIDAKGNFSGDNSVRIQTDRINEVASVDGMTVGKQESAAIISFDFLDTKNITEDSNYSDFNALKMSNSPQAGLYLCGKMSYPVQSCQILYTYKGFYISAHWNTKANDAPYAIGKPLPEVVKLVDEKIRSWIQ